MHCISTVTIHWSHVSYQNKTNPTLDISALISLLYTTHYKTLSFPFHISVSNISILCTGVLPTLAPVSKFTNPLIYLPHCFTNSYLQVITSRTCRARNHWTVQPLNQPQYRPNHCSPLFTVPSPVSRYISLIQPVSLPRIKIHIS